EDFGTIRHEIFPDGCISLFYHRSEKFDFRRVAFSGLNLESSIVPVYPCDIFWGMRISAAACANILRINPADFRNVKAIEAEKFPHLSSELLGKLSACENFGE